MGEAFDATFDAGRRAFTRAAYDPIIGSPIWGPCPCCDNWQVDFDDRVPSAYRTTQLEDALREHLLECVTEGQHVEIPGEAAPELNTEG